MKVRILMAIVIVAMLTGCASVGGVPEGPRQRLGQRSYAEIAAGICGAAGALAAGLATGNGGAAFVGGIGGAILCGLIGAGAGELAADAEDPVYLCDEDREDIYGQPCRYDNRGFWVPNW